MIELPYTICFCCYQQRVLMLHRTFPPNAQLWNGLGGKIKTGETPLASVHREMQEEASLDLRQASSLFFAGIITWGLVGCAPIKGMYAFLAHLSQSQAERITSLNTPEGLVAWKPLAWVCDPGNGAVVNNIPHFLPPILEARIPYEYFCEYEHETSSTEIFRQLVIRPLPAHIVLSDCQE
ncbi:MAG TPA: NUDIX domain-containing protein [Ktedonobacteraceae bacterium]|nr:NUDIX domain-containing protein [Ktedonobacteraceae bacterium]